MQIGVSAAFFDSIFFHIMITKSRQVFAWFSPVVRSVAGMYFVVLLLLLVPQVADGQELVVKSSFSTAETTVGREVTYSITIRKTETTSDLVLVTPERPELPKISALTFGRFQTSEQYQSTLGSDPVGITLDFEVVTNVEGRIIMPSFEMNYMGHQLHVPATFLKVRSPDNDLTGGEVDWFFFEFSERPPALHVGQRFKTSLDLYVFRGLRNVTFTSPTPVGSDFSMDKISPGPTERVITRGLYRYSVYSWPLTFTAVRSGKISILFKVNLNFRIPNDRLEFIRAVRANNAESAALIETLLQDSREESQVVFSENLNVEVNSLPQPENELSFFNAIGKFSIQTQLDNKKMEVGEPANFSIVITGEGNFGSLKTPALSFDKRWRVFAPQESFEDEDLLSFKGKQIYRYVVIPLNIEVQNLPIFEYTYYDTALNKFVTLKSDPIQIEITGNNIVRDEEIEQPSIMPEQPAESEVSLKGSIRWDLGGRQTLGQPFFRNARFYLWNGLLLGVFFGFVVMKLRQLKIEKNQKFAREIQIQFWIRKYMRLAGVAAKDENSEQFYESAFLAFCAVVASANDANVESITVEDVESRLEKMDLNDNVKRVILGYLSRYEQQRFSGSVVENPPLTHEFDRLKSILKKFDHQFGGPAQS